MTAASDQDRCDQMELVSAYVLNALPRSEASAMEAHIATCEQCRRELQTLRPIIDAFSAWPIEVLRPSQSIWDRLLERIETKTQRLRSRQRLAIGWSRTGKKSRLGSPARYSRPMRSRIA